MKKVFMTIVIILVMVGVMVAKSGTVENPNKVTRVPYDNGFYAGNYNPDFK